jgi:hypothetical protein
LVALDAGATRRAGCLLMAADARRTELGVPRTPREDGEVREARAAINRRLGADADALSPATPALSEEQAVQLALQPFASEDDRPT